MFNNYLPSFLTPSAPPSYLSQLWTSIAKPAPPPTYISQVWNTLTGTLTSTRRTMDAVLSLPMLSFLLIPTMSSYSTSLNLLFFYLTWSTLVLSHPPLKVEIVGTLAVRVLFYLVPSTFFFVFDALLPSAAVGLKAQGDAGLPLKSGKNWKKAARVLGWAFLNLLGAVALQALVEWVFTRVLGIRSAFRVTTTLPMPWGIAKDLVRGTVVREILQYVLHRYALHDPNSPLTKYHTSWYHSLDAPFPLTAHYDHPLPYLIGHFLPTYIPAVLFRFHLLTYTIYIALISLEETFAFSGYSTVPTNFILGGMARRTDKHVLCGGEGNFGPLGVADWVCGTSVGGDVMEDVGREAERHDVDGKMEGVMDGAKSKGRQIRGKARRKQVS